MTGPYTDISSFIESADPLDGIELTDYGCMVRLSSEKFTISGKWDGAIIHQVLAMNYRVRLLGVVRLPRKSKKALKKYWTGGNLSAREMARVKQSIGVG